MFMENKVANLFKRLIKHFSTYVHLKFLNMFSTNKAVANIPSSIPPIIISLTSIPSRFKELPIVLESLCHQSVKPDKIILWLSKEYKNKKFGHLSMKTIPENILNFQKRGITIRFTQDIGPYTKIIPTLKLYPNAVIITVDDDLMYKPDLVKYLYEKHRQLPDHIICSRYRNMVKKNENELIPYNNWELNCWLENCKSKIHETNSFFNSGFGTLFPPQSLPTVTADEKIFTELSPYADDVWLNAMRLLNNVKVSCIKKPQYIYLYGHKNNSKAPDTLRSINMNRKQNDIQLKQVFDRYDLYERIN